MFQDPNQGADASNFLSIDPPSQPSHIPPSGPPNKPPTGGSLPEYQYEIINHTLLGTLTGIQNAIKHLHKLNYADPNDWSKPLPTGRPNEMMAILTKRIRLQ